MLRAGNAAAGLFPHSSRQSIGENKEGLPLRTALPLSDRGPVLRSLGCADHRDVAVTPRGPPRKRRSRSRKPTTAGYDNETLEHLILTLLQFRIVENGNSAS